MLHIKLANKLRFDNFIRPICIAKEIDLIEHSENPIGMVMQVLGYGKVSPSAVKGAANMPRIELAEYQLNKNCSTL